jgi:hypothetical protein
VPAIRSTATRLTLLALMVAASGSAAALGRGMVREAPAVGTSARHTVAALPDTLAFDVEYAGIGAEGVDLIWRGIAAGPVPGMVTIRLEYAGAAEERAMPVWPVNVWLFYCADDYRRSFAAELSGSMNWRTGEMHVTGLVSAGRSLDVPLDQHVRLRRPGLAGRATLVFLPRVALGDAMAPRL